MGDLLLQAGGTLTISADLKREAGAVSLIAQADLILSNGVSVTSDGLSLDLEAGNNLVIQAGAQVSTGSAAGNVRLLAGQDLFVTGISAGTGSVRAIAQNGNIYDGGDTTMDIQSGGLILSAGQSIALANALDLDVDTVAARGAGINLSETDAIAIDLVADVSVTRVNTLGGNEILSDGPLSDLISHSNGDVTLISQNGTITISEGTAPFEVGVQADGTGQIVLSAQGAGSDLIIDSNIIADSGTITLLAANGFTQRQMSAIFSASGDVSVSTAADDLTVAAVATTGQVTLISAAQILGIVAVDAGITAALVLDAQGAIADLSTAVVTLNAQSATGSIALIEQDALTIERALAGKPVSTSLPEATST